MPTRQVSEIFETDDVLGPRLKAALASRLWARLPDGLERDSRKWRLEVLKFRPRRRMSLRVGVPDRGKAPVEKETFYIMKIWYNRRGERISSRLVELNAQLRATGENLLCLPDPLFYDRRAHAMVYLQTEGRASTRDLKRGLSRDWVKRFSRVFAVFHQLSLKAIPNRTAEDELKCVRDLLDSLETRHPLRKSLVSLLSLLEQTEPPPTNFALIHRDLYDQQILLTDNGRIGLIDLDDIAMGDPMLDVGNFLAHMHLMTHWRRRPEKLGRVRRRLLSAYGNFRGEALEALVERARWYEAVALARLSVFRAMADEADFGLHLVQAARGLIESKSMRVTCMH